MRITLIDDSTPFDGFVPATKAMGGAEKAFASLPGALVRRGHDVQVFNRCRFAMNIEGASWEGWEATRPLQTDVLIAYRAAPLLTAVRARHRILWLTAPARALSHPAHSKAITELQPTLVFQSSAHADTWTGRGGRVAVIRPGVRNDYLSDLPPELAEAPRAIVTTHPSHGLSWLLDLWREKIRSAVPNAELHVFSAVLDRGQDGGEVADELRPLFDKAMAARHDGVVIRMPQGDAAMADEYRKARLHLYPGHPDDMGCFTLAETQAMGVPAVTRDLGAASERVLNGQTGYVVPDDEAFANVAVQILTNDDLFWSMNRDGRLEQRRSWDVAAAEFERVFS